MNEKRHFLIFERDTEEEFILTLSDLLRECGHSVSLFISQKIWDIIGPELNTADYKKIKVFGAASLQEMLSEMEEYIKKESVSMTFMPRFFATDFSELNDYVWFMKNNCVCGLIESYDRWIAKMPPIQLNGRKLIKRNKILDWLKCKRVFHHFSCYFVTEIHVNSINPLKIKVQKMTGKKVFDLPFKVNEELYQPHKNFDMPVFVIPGSIDHERRNYIPAMDFFSREDVLKRPWKLILLGRPVGEYGRKIVSIAENINLRASAEKVIVFDRYIKRSEFEQHMKMSTHIIAPVTEKGYKYGKDSGALYDIFKYNKFGIFDCAYFYSGNLKEIDMLFSYRNIDELNRLLQQILDNKLEYSNILNNITHLRQLFSKQTYIENIQKNIEDYFALSK